MTREKRAILLTGLVLRTALAFVLFALPCLAGCAFVLRRGFRSYAMVGLAGLAGVGVAGYAAFWLWFFAPPVGRIVSAALPIASFFYLRSAVKILDGEARRLLRGMLTPLALTVSATLMILSAGFLYGGWETPLETAAIRFTHTLPPDNTLPYLFSQDAARGNIPRHFFTDWHSSDRPPLQTGIVLSDFAYMRGIQGYAVFASMLQSLWIFAVWMLLSEFQVNRKAARLVLAVCLFSSFVFINTFYVWPKLLAAAYMIGFITMLSSGRIRASLGNSRIAGGVAGALLALGLLAHGGTGFAVSGFVCTMLVGWKRVPPRGLMVVAVTAICLYLPWILYQKLFDPPGDRLLKWHLAGIIKVDSRSFAEGLRDAYRQTPREQILFNKRMNFKSATGHVPEYLDFWRSLAKHVPVRNSGDVASALSATRRIIDFGFYFFVPNLGVLVLGLPALLIGVGRRWRSNEWKVSAALWMFVVITNLVWCLLMFGPGTSHIHQGTYVTVLFGYMAAVLGLWAVSRWLAWLVGGLQITLSTYLVAYPYFADGAVLAKMHFSYGALTLCAVSLVLAVYFIREFGSFPRSSAGEWNESFR